MPINTEINGITIIITLLFKLILFVMAKLVHFLQTDVQTREELTSTSLVEPKHLQHPPPFIIFAAKITIKIIGIWKDSFFS